MTQFGQISGDLLHQAYVPAQGTAGTDDNFPVWTPAAAATVIGVKFVPSSAITADPTNFSTYTLTNKVAGAGSTSVATRAWSATNSVASTPEAMTLSGTAANLLVAAGDNLEIVKTHGGTGLVIPDGLLVITYRFR